MSTQVSDTWPVASSGTFTLGDRTVHRLGDGATRSTGEGIWGPTRDRGEAVRVLRRAVELGVTLIDTADSYGPHHSEELIREALHPYPNEPTIATKACPSSNTSRTTARRRNYGCPPSSSGH